MVADLIDERLRVLKTHADSDGLGLDKDLRTMQVAVDVACRVPRSQQHRAVEGTIPRADDPTHLTTLEDQLLHTAREVHLTTRGDDLLAHTTDDDRELVRTDMWVGIDEDLRVGTEATEDTEDLLHAPTLLATRIELTVREGTRTAFAKAIVRLGVDDARLLQLDEVTTALHDVLPTLYDDGAHAQLDEP